MLDKIAEAICDAGAEPKHKLWRHWAEEVSSRNEDEAEFAKEMLDARRLEAREALRVLREPSDAMLTAYLDALESPCDPKQRSWHMLKARKRWVAMIDAALAN